MGITIPLWITLAGCSKSASDKPKDKPGGGKDDTTTALEPELIGDLEITKISIYQGVESVLYEDGDSPDSIEMPIIVGREALLRVHVKPDDDFEVRRVSGLLTVTTLDDEEVFDSRIMVEGSSKIGDLETTINYEIPADLMKQTTAFSLELREINTNAPGGGDEEDVTWNSEDFGGLNTEATDELQIVIVPIRYNYDGSGRLPDTSDTQVQRIADLAQGMYPASNVVVRVDEPLNWPNEIEPFNQNQWGNLLFTLNDMRAEANEPPNTYYYAMFNPEPSINAFCVQGCILGLSLVGFSANDPYFRASIGIGYPGDISSETLVHEVGHAHGREHAPCGLYGQSSDPDYPYGGAELGSWGYDIVTKQLFNPNDTVDMMSYCSPIWVSDYTFYSLYQRMQAVANQNRSMPMVRSTVQVGADGDQLVRPPRQMSDLSDAPRVDVQLFDTSGQLASVTTAAWFPYDHIAGGLAVLDEVLPEGWTARVQ